MDADFFVCQVFFVSNCNVLSDAYLLFFMWTRSCSPSASKMDFSALDGTLQHCRGIAGQRLSILQFLGLVGTNSSPATSGCQGYFVNAGPGIYGVSVSAPKSECDGTKKATQCKDNMLYVILWPPSAENATVDSRSITATLMRYLTQLCREVSVEWWLHCFMWKIFCLLVSLSPLWFCVATQCEQFIVFLLLSSAVFNNSVLSPGRWLCVWTTRMRGLSHPCASACCRKEYRNLKLEES